MVKLREKIFPYGSFYPNQRELIEIIESSLENGRKCIVEAATGSGKTIAVLTAVIPYMKKNRKKVVYLTRTHKQMDRVIEEGKKIMERCKVSIVPITGKKEMCINEMASETKNIRELYEMCKTLREKKECRYYLNITSETSKKLEREIINNAMYSKEIKSICEEFRICPYELVKMALNSADIIVASYLYILDPYIREGFLNSIACHNLEEVIVIFDEAHNVPEFAKNVMKMSLSKYSLSSMKKELLKYRKELKDIDEEVFEETGIMLDNLQDELSNIEIDTYRLYFKDILKIFGIPCERIQKFSGVLELFGELVRKKEYRSYLGHLSEFLTFAYTIRDSPKYAYFLSKTKSGFKIEISPLDPKIVLEEIVNNVHNLIFLSGTLYPLDPFSEIVGVENAMKKSFPPPFPKENIGVLVTSEITTKFEMRTREMFYRINDYISEIARLTPKNIGVFVPSFKFMNALLDAGLERKIEKKLLHEREDMSSSENYELVRRFKNYARKGGAVLLGVQGGRNSEGEDYPGDMMNAVCVVGVPYAEPNAVTDAQIEYYESTFRGRGKYYGYFLDAHRKLGQTAGRAHRSIDDKAMIIFLDNRVRYGNVKRDLPLWISERMKVVSSMAGLRYELLRFWSRKS